MKTKIEKIMEGRMGTNFTPTFVVLVDGVEVAFSKRKWHAEAMTDALVSGKIAVGGDPAMRLDKWAYANDLELFKRLLTLPK